MTLLILLASCELPRLPPMADIVDACDLDPADTGVCLACVDDAACGLKGNPCFDVAYCAHVDDLLALPDSDCTEARMHPWPDPSGCRCIGGSVQLAAPIRLIPPSGRSRGTATAGRSDPGSVLRRTPTGRRRGHSAGS